MTRENLLFAIIGILFGFIVGFMFASTMSQRSAQVARVPRTIEICRRIIRKFHRETQRTRSRYSQTCRQAISKARSEPNNFDAQMKAAELYYQIQRNDQAIEYLLKANQLKPDSYEAIVALGQVNIDAQHYDQAEKWLKAALLKKPEDVQVLASLTFALLEKGDAEAATKAIATLEKVDSNNAGTARASQQVGGLKIR